MTIIGILIYPQVEVLDFCGPFEVFRNINQLRPEVDISLVVISKTTETVNAQGLLVIPHHSFNTAPQCDILVIPGGAGMWLKDQHDYQQFVRTQYRQLKHLITVCTGALLVGQLGLLTTNMDATTHQESIQVLKQLAPRANVLPEVRFTHASNIIMTGGISAGIDGSLYLVASIWDNELAEDIAYYMEYDWRIRQPNQPDPAIL